jgi:D-methionine transport system substrate-binding protein
MRKFTFSLILIIAAVVLAACGGGEASDDSDTGEEQEVTEVTFGATAGPYADMTSNVIAPLLEEKGYEVEMVEFSDYIQPNNALDDGSLDANLFQHTIYLENFEEENEMDLTALITVPTAPMGIYSNVYDSIDAIEDGSTIAIPNDPTNGARAFTTLQDEGLIELDPEADVLTVSENDVVSNPKNLEFQPLEAGQLPRAVESADLSAVPGNFALAADMDLLDALALEDMADDFRNVVAVAAENDESQLAQDIKEVVESEEFEQKIDEDFQGFGKPTWMTE